MIRAVIDTNILVSGLIKPDSPPGRILRTLRDAEFVVVCSSVLIEELAAVLLYPRIRDKYGIDRPAREGIADLIALRGELVTPAERIRVCRDPDDDHVLEAAIAGNAEFIVTGDADLLELEVFRKIKIVRAGEFLTALDPSPALY
jgi:putative PIN family toxin of toxin-antitoxin system